MHSLDANLNTPLTRGMLETLMEAHEKQMMKLPPLDAGNTRCSKGLILRGFIEIKPWTNPDGKKVMSLFLTYKGISYLNRLK